MPKTRKADAARKQIVLTDPMAIRALAHPARLAVIDELYQRRIRTSSELAELTGLTPSAMSYHLRALEKWGIVERVETASDGRERPWRAAGDGLSWENEESGADQILNAHFLRRLSNDLGEWQRFAPKAPKEWKSVSTLTRGFPLLTSDEARLVVSAMNDTVRDITQGRTPANAPADAKPVGILFSLVPLVEGFT